MRISLRTATILVLLCIATGFVMIGVGGSQIPSDTQYHTDTSAEEARAELKGRQQVSEGFKILIGGLILIFTSLSTFAIALRCDDTCIRYPEPILPY